MMQEKIFQKALYGFKCNSSYCVTLVLNTFILQSYLMAGNFIIPALQGGKRVLEM